MKPILCFYVGYAPDYTVSQGGVYGSELALKKLSELLSAKYQVYIFGTSFRAHQEGGVTFMHSNLLNQFGQQNKIDVMIISRYIHYFLEFNVKARKTYLWLHDVLPQPYWNGLALPAGGKYLLENMLDQLDGIVCLCEWQNRYVLQNIAIPAEKVSIIGNGIDPSDFQHPIQKIKGRFIYMSNPSRGLERLVEHFHLIRKIIPEAELHIYRGLEEFDKHTLDKLQGYTYIKFKGKMQNKDLIPEIMKSEYWYYPTDFYETYCISALEAQMSGCLCITSGIGALSTTVGDRGIVINLDPRSPEFLQQVLQEIEFLEQNPGKKLGMINKEIIWAQQQTWENRMKEWVYLIQQEK